jgi:hypothetical protein
MRHEDLITRWSALWAKGGRGRTLVSTLVVVIVLALPTVLAIVGPLASWND